MKTACTVRAMSPDRAHGERNARCGELQLWRSEYTAFNPRTQEIFHGCPEMKDGYLWVSEKPGWGIEIDEKAAAKVPFTDRNGLNGGWGEIRKSDGTVIKQ